LIVVAGFQALPFQEPATGLVFARGRWYEPQTGTFLTPDPLGYKDSSNLYAFAGGDPVNGRDPSGEMCDRKKGEGLLDFGTRCAQEGLAEAKKQGEYALGGVLNAVVFPVKLIAGTARFLQDPPALPSDFVGLSREEAARKHRQNAELIDNVRHPVTNAQRRWNTTKQAILAADGSGDHVSAGYVAADYGSGESFTAFTLAEGGVGLLKFGNALLKDSVAASSEAGIFEYAARGGEFLDDLHTTSPFETPPPNAIFGTNKSGQLGSRRKWRGYELDDAYNSAEVGPSGGRLCPDCGVEVMVPPGTGVPRDWHMGHARAWTNQWLPPDATRRMFRNAYGEGVTLTCGPCNLKRSNKDLTH
jgi:RHS repeat-associated protein